MLAHVLRGGRLMTLKKTSLSTRTAGLIALPRAVLAEAAALPGTLRPTTMAAPPAPRLDGRDDSGV